jgi:Cu/Ag efflux pump CusA
MNWLASTSLQLSVHRYFTQIEHPLAVVILGGLVTSTLLNLFLMPALYLRDGVKRSAETSPAVSQEA